MPMIADEPRSNTTPAGDQAANTPDTGVSAADNNGNGATPPADVTTPTPALARFHSCRWRAQPDEGAFCTHRDVLPMAGKTGFVAESWCPDCAYFKVRRAPRKREYNQY
jgi:hypothetical protein